MDLILRMKVIMKNVHCHTCCLDDVSIKLDCFPLFLRIGLACAQDPKN